MERLQQGQLRGLRWEQVQEEERREREMQHWERMEEQRQMEEFQRAFRGDLYSY
jgi:hypothetical protein